MAEEDGRLAAGDQILTINGEDVRTATQEHVATILKVSGFNLVQNLGDSAHDRDGRGRRVQNFQENS